MTGTPRKATAQEHDHDHGEKLWQWFDWAVIVAVVVLVAIAAEWLIGLVVRERLTAGASRYLRRASREQAATADEDHTTG